jgi:hypothetical protein
VIPFLQLHRTHPVWVLTVWVVLNGPLGANVLFAEDMKSKVSGALAESFRFDPELARDVDLLDDEVVLMEPVEVQEQSLSRNLEASVAQERIKLSTTFDIQKGGEFFKNDRLTVEAKPHQELIKTRFSGEGSAVRWSLLRFSW